MSAVPGRQGGGGGGIGTLPTPPLGVGGGLGGRGMVPGVEVEEILWAGVLGVAIPWSEVEMGAQVNSTAINWSHSQTL